jgi:LDH2 family malate/lactate/ureidoglycolate dehydrogenase
MADRPIIVTRERLKAFIVGILEALKTSPPNAALTADLMVRTDLRGVDSHGIGMLPRYVELTRAGFIRPWAEAVVARDDLGSWTAKRGWDIRPR